MKIRDADTPMKKLQSINKMSEKIVKSINKFWKGLDIKKDKLTIDGDTLLMIYIYIVFKSRI